MSKVMEPEVDERVEQFASACVLSTKGASLLDTSTLAAAGLRTRTSPACMTDVLITSASLAFILQTGLELVTPSDTEAFWDRVAKLKLKGFKISFVLLCGISAVLRPQIITATVRFMGNPAIVELPTEKDLTQCILEIAKAIIGVTDDSIRQQRYDDVEQPAALQHALMSLPGVHLTEPQARELRQLGSIQNVASASARDILCISSATPHQCVPPLGRELSHPFLSCSEDGRVLSILWW